LKTVNPKESTTRENWRSLGESRRNVELSEEIRNVEDLKKFRREAGVLPSLEDSIIIVERSVDLYLGDELSQEDFEKILHRVMIPARAFSIILNLMKKHLGDKG